MYRLQRNIIEQKKLPIALFAAIAIGLNGLFLSIFVGLSGISVWLSVLLFLFLIISTLVLFVQRAEFIITEKGIVQHLQPYARWWTLQRKEIDRTYSWSRLSSYEDGTETKQHRSARRYLKLKMDDGCMMRVDEGDVSGAADYDLFLQAFYSYTGLKKNDPALKLRVPMGKLRDMYDYKSAQILHRTIDKPLPDTTQQGRKKLLIMILGLVFGALSLALMIAALVSWIINPTSEEWLRMVGVLLLFMALSGYLLYHSTLQSASNSKAQTR